MRRRGRCGCNQKKGGGVGVIGRNVGGKMRGSKRRWRGGVEEEEGVDATERMEGGGDNATGRIVEVGDGRRRGGREEGERRRRVG